VDLQSQQIVGPGPAETAAIGKMKRAQLFWNLRRAHRHPGIWTAILTGRLSGRETAA